MSIQTLVKEHTIDTLIALQLWLSVDTAVGLLEASEEVENYEQCQGINNALDMFISSDREFNCTIGNIYFNEES